jgi:glutamine synthetase
VPAAAAARPGVVARGAALRVRAQFSDDANLELSGFGEHCFKGDVANRYLGKYGETAALLDTPAWTEKKSDIVAAAILDWAKDNGASVFCHWCAPKAQHGVDASRADATAQVPADGLLGLPPRPDGPGVQHDD